MSLCSVQLFSKGAVEDSLLIWRAKTASMDADCSIMSLRRHGAARTRFAQASECRSSCDLLSVLVNRKFNRAMVQSAMTTFKIIFCSVERDASSITFASNHEFRYVCSPALVDGLRKERNAYSPERSRCFRIDKAIH